MKLRIRDKLARYASDGELDTPFKRAAAEWDHRMGSTVLQARNWRLAALIGLSGWMLVSAGLVYLVLRPPDMRMVTIDHDGMPTSIGQLGVIAADFKATDRQVEHYLRAFVIDARRVSTDPGVTKQGWIRAHARAVGAGNNQLHEFLKPFGTPLKRSREVMVTVEITSVLKITGATWQVDWKEQMWAPHAPNAEQSSWRGLHRVQLRTPRADDPDNIIGFFVEEFHWTRLRQ